MGQGTRPRVIWQPQPGPQTALLRCPIPDVLFGGARGGGKTDALLGDFVAHASRYLDVAVRGVIFRRSMPELDEVQRRARELYPAIGATWQAGARQWRFPGGATLKMRWLEREADADRYQGHSYHWLGLDEVGTWPAPDGIDKLRSTLRSAEGIPCLLRLTANPGGPGHAWLKERYIDPAPPMTPFFDADRATWRVFIPSRLQDNRKLFDADPGYIDRIRASGPPWLVRAWLEGDWTSVQRGGLFDIARIGIAEAIPRGTQLVRAWDLAATEGRGDYTVGALLGAMADGRYIVADIRRARIGPHDVEASIANTAAQDGWEIPIDLPQDPGQAGKAQIAYLVRRLAGHHVFSAPVTGDKQTRALPFAAQVNVGNVVLVRAPWNRAFLDELDAFPTGPHDDQVDATASAFSRLIAKEASTVSWGTLD
ncbi:phage terminase large subunit [Acidiferrobacter sp.]|uniref:phage terminase large subunit n=1 Tax=Acidiferrobacter sp. TaxID=1872107 RepID=UPI00261E368B|nr:phage terminase large subunit [Acidiferrobacter sp.]